MRKIVHELEQVCGALGPALVGLSMQVDDKDLDFDAACESYDRLFALWARLKVAAASGLGRNADNFIG